MSKDITIPGFKGGQSVDLYDSLQKQSFQKSDNLDVFVDSNVLTPLAKKLTAVTLPAVAGHTDILVKNSFYASNSKQYFAGSATISAASNFVLWSTDTLESSPTWGMAYASGGTGTPGNSVLEEYKDGLFFGWGTNLDRWGNLSGSPSRTNIGTVTTGVTYLRSHRGLGYLYFAHNSGHTIGRYDNTTFTASLLVLENDDVVVGIEEMGQWVVVGVRGSGSRRDRFLIWDGSSTTVTDVININDNGLQGFKVINGVITYITLTNANTNYLRLAIIGGGGRSEVVKEQQVATGTASVEIFNNFSSFGDVFFYGLNGPADSRLDLGIFAYGTPKSTISKYHTLWSLVSTGVLTAVSISSIKYSGTTMVVTWGSTSGGNGTQHIDAFGGNITAAVPTGVYESNIFPIGNPGKIKRIIINHKPLPASCGFTVQVKHYGHYPKGTSIPAEDSYATLFTPEGNAATSGMSQSTTNTTYTEIDQPNVFKEARFAQIKISFDEVLTTNAASIVFPILIETE